MEDRVARVVATRVCLHKMRSKNMITHESINHTNLEVVLVGVL